MGVVPGLRGVAMHELRVARVVPCRTPSAGTPEGRLMPEVTYIGYDALIAPGREAVKEATIQSGEDLVAQQQAAAPVETGTLRAGIHIDSIDAGGDSCTVTTATGGESSAYAIRVHEGGPEYPIEAKDGGYLNWPGAEHPVKSVMHPATVGNPYMTNPLLANIGTYQAAMARAAAAAY
jgi:hypothetical protein